MSDTDNPQEGELPVDADLGPANADDDDDLVEKGKHAKHDKLDDVEEVLPQGATEETPGTLP